MSGKYSFCLGNILNCPQPVRELLWHPPCPKRKLQTPKTKTFLSISSRDICEAARSTPTDLNHPCRYCSDHPSRTRSPTAEINRGIHRSSIDILYCDTTLLPRRPANNIGKTAIRSADGGVTPTAALLRVFNLLEQHHRQPHDTFDLSVERLCLS